MPITTEKLLTYTSNNRTVTHPNNIERTLTKADLNCDYDYIKKHYDTQEKIEYLEYHIDVKQKELRELEELAQKTEYDENDIITFKEKQSPIAKGIRNAAGIVGGCAVLFAGITFITDPILSIGALGVALGFAGVAALASLYINKQGADLTTEDIRNHYQSKAEMVKEEITKLQEELYQIQSTFA